MTAVSVVIPTHNSSQWIASAVESVLNQTHANLEVVAADDASSDDTVSVLHRYAARDPRVRVMVNPRNLGFGANFERALRESRGGLIAPCDQDDVWLPSKLESLVAAMGARSMSYCDSTLIDEHGQPLGYSMSQVVPMRSFDDPAPFAFGNCVSGHAMLFRRQLLQHALPTPASFFYDWWLAAVAAAFTGIVFCEGQLVLYRQHGANVTNERFSQMLRESGADRELRGEDSAAVPGRAAPKRERGYRLRYLRETEQRLAALAQLPGAHQSFLGDLHRLWHARETQWISPRLWRRMRSNKDRLLALTQMSEKRRSRYCADFFWGLRTKGLTRKAAYTNE